MSQIGKSQYPEKDTPGLIEFYWNTQIGMMESRWAALRWTAAKAITLAEKMEDGPLAFITLPPAILLRGTAKTILDNTSKTFKNYSIRHAAEKIFGAWGGAFGGIMMLPSYIVRPESELLTAAFMGGAALAGSLIGPAIISTGSALITAAFGAISSIPRALNNIPTGIRRTRLAFTQASSPEIINPLPDPGLEPKALPAPAALLKLAGVKEGFNQSQNAASVAATNTTPAPAKSPKGPAIS